MPAQYGKRRTPQPGGAKCVLQHATMLAELVAQTIDGVRTRTVRSEVSAGAAVRRQAGGGMKRTAASCMMPRGAEPVDTILATQ